MDHPPSNPSSSIPDRKTRERERRNEMKSLYSQLNSLLPRDQQSSKNTMSLRDQIDEASNYIRKLEANVEELKKKKDRLMGVGEVIRNDKSSSESSSSSLVAPRIEIHDLGSAMEVVLITGLDCHFMFNEIIRVIYEEGLEVVNTSFSVVDGTVFHMIHSKVEDGMECAVARVSGRLKKFL